MHVSLGVRVLLAVMVVAMPSSGGYHFCTKLLQTFLGKAGTFLWTTIILTILTKWSSFKKIT